MASSNQQQQQQGGEPQYETVSSMLGNLDFTNASQSLSPVGQLGSGLEHIFTEDTPFVSASGGFVPSRGMGDDLCYGTGTSYLTGLAVGGTWGFFQGLRTPLPSQSTRLRINAILNAMTRRGPFIGNSVGVMALFYNLINSGIAMQVGREHEVATSIAAATTAGVLFKSTAGIRAAGTAGLACASLAALWQLSKRARDELPSLSAIASRSFA